MSLSGKVAIVSGAAQGLGRAFAVRLAEEGCEVLGFDVKKEEDQCRLKALIKTMSARNTKLHSTLNNFSTEMNTQVEEQWEQFESMIKLLNIEY